MAAEIGLTMLVVVVTITGPLIRGKGERHLGAIFSPPKIARGRQRNADFRENSNASKPQMIDGYRRLKDVELTTLRSVEVCGVQWAKSGHYVGVAVPLTLDISIVAVHGLNGDAFKTGMSKTSRISWLSDANMLPGVLRNARFLTFGYNADITSLAGSTSSQRSSGSYSTRKLLLLSWMPSEQ
jgi:hypothetical protein